MQGPIPSLNDTEIRKQLSKMGRNKACGPDDLPIEAIIVVAEMKPELLTYILQRIMADGIPDSWKKSKLIPIFKNKGDILECNNSVWRENRSWRKCIDLEAEYCG